MSFQKIDQYMKKIFLVFAAMSAALVSGCSKNNPDGPVIDPVDNVFYTGKMTVLDGETENVSENVTVEVSFTADDTVQLLFKKVKFVPQMPMTLDVTVPGVKRERQKDGSYVLSGDGIVPETMTLPYSKFTVTGLSGTLAPGSLVMSLKFGEYPVEYSGTAVLTD